MRGHGHDDAVSVVGKDIVRRPNRQALAVDRVDPVALQEDARLGALGAEAINLARALHLLEVGGKLLLGGSVGALDELCREVRVRGHHHERGAVQSVGASRVDLDGLVATFDLKGDVGTA